MKHQALGADTEIVLLLCGRFGGERQEPFQPLSAREYGELAKWLNARRLRPANLLNESGQGNLPKVHEAGLDRRRVDFLLGRGTALALALERWSRGGLWVISRGDGEFPKRLKRHLRHAAPPLLYGAGDKALLEAGGVAIVGSRDAGDAALDFARAVASRCATEALGVVSGGARGIDAAAMQAATDAGGTAIGVLASDLLTASVNRQNRIGIEQGRLALVSPFHPEAGFNAGNAMARNKYIYTLADRALVVDSALGHGGTWEGALENLQQKWIPLFVRTPGDGAGNAALVDRGGIAFSFGREESGTMGDFFARVTSASAAQQGAADAEPLQPSLPGTEDAGVRLPASLPCVPFEEPEARHHQLPTSVPVAAPAPAPDPADPAVDTRSAGELLPSAVDEQRSIDVLDMYRDFLAKLTQALADTPRSEEELAMLLCIEKAQAKAWLKRATEAGSVEKLKKPVRYALCQQASLH